MKIIFFHALHVGIFAVVHSSTQDTLEHTFKMLSGDSDLVTVALCFFTLIFTPFRVLVRPLNKSNSLLQLMSVKTSKALSGDSG